jgi:hypothetical protein
MTIIATAIGRVGSILWVWGEIELQVPRDRKGEFESRWLSERRGQDAELEAFLAEPFLAGLSTRDLARISEKGWASPQMDFPECRTTHRVTWVVAR